jgi:spore coat polysaccharide biosynthesis protein SpsF
MTPRAVVIVQARMGSRRLPGKSLADISGRSLLAHAVLRLRTSGLPVVVATTDRDEDDVIAVESTRCGAAVYRGSADDVLARYVGAAEQTDATWVVRATADNPAVDAEGVSRVVDVITRTGADHVSEAGLPAGAAVEAVSLDALRRAAELASDAPDREHVTTFVRRDPRFTLIRAIAPADRRRAGLSLTVDTADDLDFMRAVLQPFSGCTTPPPFLEVLGVADRLWPARSTRLMLREVGA